MLDKNVEEKSERLDACTGSSFRNGVNSLNRDLKLRRIETLRCMKQQNSCVPNMKARLWALRLLDEVMNRVAISLPGGTSVTNTRAAPRATLRAQKDEGFPHGTVKDG